MPFCGNPRRGLRAALVSFGYHWTPNYPPHPTPATPASRQPVHAHRGRITKTDESRMIFSMIPRTFCAGTAHAAKRQRSVGGLAYRSRRGYYGEVEVSGVGIAAARGRNGVSRRSLQEISNRPFGLRAPFGSFSRLITPVTEGPNGPVLGTRVWRSGYPEVRREVREAFAGRRRDVPWEGWVERVPGCRTSGEARRLERRV